MDLFGDPGLFAEFDNSHRDSDKLILSTLKSDDSRTEDDFDENGVEGELPLKQIAENEVGDNLNEDECTETQTGTAEEGYLDNRDASGLRKKEMEKEIAKLKKQIKHYKEQCDILQPMSGKEFSGPGPLVQVLYLTEQLSSKHRAQIEGFISSIIQDTDVKDVSNKIVGCTHIYQSFCVDKLSQEIKDEVSTDIWKIPEYYNLFNAPLSQDEEETGPEKRKRAKASCFNCGGEHSLRECKDKRDFKRINEAKQKFMAEKGDRGPGSVRYTADEPRFSQFKAGVISGDLRKALGLHQRQIPLHIYQMRIVGYPPGHLIETEEESSGLALFDISGQEVAANDSEDGELETNVLKVKYDASKLISYEGFNVPLSSGVVDESQMMRFPPQRSDQSREALARTLTQNNLTEGKRMQHEAGGSDKKRFKCNETSSLDESQGDKPPSEDINSSDSSVFKTPAVPRTESAQNASSSTDNTSLKLNFDDLRTPSPSQTSHSSSLSRTPGTPLPSMSTSISGLGDISAGKNSLPDADKFRANVEEHIPYENLPDATGVYDKMRRVIDDIRLLKKTS